MAGPVRVTLNHQTVRNILRGQGAQRAVKNAGQKIVARAPDLPLETETFVGRNRARETVRGTRPLSTKERAVLRRAVRR